MKISRWAYVSATEIYYLQSRTVREYQDRNCKGCRENVYTLLTLKDKVLLLTSIWVSLNTALSQFASRQDFKKENKKYIKGALKAKLRRIN